MAAWRLRVSAFTCLNLLAAPICATETVGYSYDALGRLTATSTAGGPSDGLQTSTGFDPAGNRQTYGVTGAPPSSPTFSISDATVLEGGAAAVIVSRAGPLSATNTVQYATVNGSATAPADYGAASGTLTFGPGEASKTINISTVADNIADGTETFSVSLSAPSGGGLLGRSTGTVTIQDADAPPTLSIGNATVTEGGVATITVTRSGATGAPASVGYSTADGTATAPGDYTATSGTLNFAAGDTSKTISVPTTNDSIYETTEAFSMILSGATGASIASGTGTVTINDDDPVPVFSIANVTVGEGAGSAVLTVTKTGGTTQASTVAYATRNGTATAPGDYTTSSGTLSFAAGETTKTLSVPIIDDTAYEATENFMVDFSNATNATVSQTAGTAVVNIIDNDAPPVFSISGSPTVNEGQPLIFTVTKTGNTSQVSTVNFATANGSATAGEEYTATSGTLTFAAGDTSQTISVPTIGNAFYDGTTTVNVNLSSPNTATLGTSQATGTILDTTPAPTIYLGASGSSTNQVSVNEGGTITFNVGLSGSATRRPVTVNYSTANGTAVAGSDFVGTSGSFAIPGFGSAAFTVPTIDDNLIEGNETFTVSINSPSGFPIGQSQMTATIIDNDFTVQNPVANPDNAGSVKFCGSVTINPVANDTDPGGRYPLTLVSVAGGGFTYTISGNNLTIEKNPGGTAGTKTLTYVVRNTGGATATGNITITVTGPQCTN